MAIYVPPVQKKSFGQSINQGLGQALERGSQMMESHKQQEMAKQRAQKIQQLTGMDVSGMSDKQQDIVLGEILKGQQKEQLFQKKAAFVNEAIDQEKPTFDFESDQVTSKEKMPKSNLKLHSNEKIARMAVVDPNVAREMREQNKAIEARQQKEEEISQKKFEADRTYHSKTSEPVLAEADEVMKKAPIRKGLIDQQRRDIASGETSGILPYMADKTGIEMWRSPEAARFKTASKQRFIENLSSIGGGARPNMFIEQQLVGAQAALGRDPEANQTVLDMEEFIDDLELQRAKYVREIAKEDREKFGYVKNDVADRADEKMAGFAEQRQDEMAYDIRKRRENNMTDQELTQEIIGKRVTPDTPLTIRAMGILMIKNNDDVKKAYAEAKRLGFRIPTDKTYMR